MLISPSSPSLLKNIKRNEFQKNNLMMKQKKIEIELNALGKI